MVHVLERRRDGERSAANDGSDVHNLSLVLLVVGGRDGEPVADLPLSLEGTQSSEVNQNDAPLRTKRSVLRQYSRLRQG